MPLCFLLKTGKIRKDHFRRKSKRKLLVVYMGRQSKIDNLPPALLKYIDTNLLADRRLVDNVLTYQEIVDAVNQKISEKHHHISPSLLTKYKKK